jgi:hypothetical protein
LPSSQASDEDATEENVFPNHLVHEAERRKAPAEQREADALAGELAASLHALFVRVTAPWRVVRQVGGRALSRIATKDKARVADRRQWPECAGGRGAS